ncbi:hypothetical protein SAMN05192566_0914 [Methylophilus rhizosphaerae]|uniref:DUF2065 domain-containing protein n=1 Tax=Methylophilus rhizosphaerae TaxID=492660 RepID=A0A1G9B011_9PROT|nr:DUF2065 domain-containing protein [Methylophilus rhizosphaerae]SDK32911.1 hypothetical protein SAMN05192566_0914 [Methylophilus rhizosphaerae]
MNWWWLLGGVLLIEGLMPLLFTQSWRQTFEKLLQLRDGQLRFIGFISVLTGLLVLWFNR